jgi:hypothetical protein
MRFNIPCCHSLDKDKPRLCLALPSHFILCERQVRQDDDDDDDDIQRTGSVQQQMRLETTINVDERTVDALTRSLWANRDQTRRENGVNTTDVEMNVSFSNKWRDLSCSTRICVSFEIVIERHETLPCRPRSVNRRLTSRQQQSSMATSRTFH